MHDKNFEMVMDNIVSAMKEAGYEPFEQLVGYVKNGDLAYITRKNDARMLIQNFSREQIIKYIKAKAGDDIAKTI